jgi:putative transposase
MMLAHQIEFSPYTHEQEIVLRKSCGVARFTYNWALAEWTRQYKTVKNLLQTNLKAI